MGATTPDMILRGAKSGNRYSLSCYFAGSDAAGYVVPCRFNGTAGSGSPTTFRVNEPCVIEHMNGPATGRLTVEVNGLPTPIGLNLATVISMAGRAGMSHGNLAGGPNREYRLLVTTAMAS